MKYLLFFCVSFGLLCLFLAGTDATGTELVLHTQGSVSLEIVGFDTLAEVAVFKGELEAQDNRRVATDYQGLALLVFAGGQSYPLLIGTQNFTVNITSPDKAPTFTGSGENTSFYRALADDTPVPGQYVFASLMVRAKRLLDSSSLVRTLEDLQAEKQAFYQFVRDNYRLLRRSDMIRRLIDQSFMMHEYASYHRAGESGRVIQKRFQREVLAGVAGWLRVLAPHIPESEILNYCVGLYYNRSMVTLAGRIMENFQEASFCPGEEPAPVSFPEDLQVVVAEGKTKKLAELKGDRMFSLVSVKCPVSLVATVLRGRKIVEEKSPVTLIVVPMEKLADNHLAMNRMIAGGRLLFVSDEKWRKRDLHKQVRLPFFLRP